MLSFSNQYNIAGGIYYSYQNKSNKKIFAVKHSEKTMERNKKFLNYHKFEQVTKQNFVLSCLYVILKNNPTSFIEFLKLLSEVDLKDVYNFKDDIKLYAKKIKDDVKYLKENNTTIDEKVVLQAFNNQKIQFYTAYFYLYFRYGMEKIEELSKSRLYGRIVNKLRFFAVYFTFKTSSLETIKNEIINQLDV